MAYGTRWLAWCRKAAERSAAQKHYRKSALPPDVAHRLKTIKSINLNCFLIQYCFILFYHIVYYWDISYKSLYIKHIYCMCHAHPRMGMYCIRIPLYVQFVPVSFLSLSFRLFLPLCLYSCVGVTPLYYFCTLHSGIPIHMKTNCHFLFFFVIVVHFPDFIVIYTTHWWMVVLCTWTIDYYVRMCGCSTPGDRVFTIDNHNGQWLKSFHSWCQWCYSMWCLSHAISVKHANTTHQS